MYPEIFSIPSYYVMITAGVFFAVLAFRLICSKLQVNDGVYHFYSIDIVISIAVGFGGAMLFQSLYDFIKTGVFVWRGLTFMGGLVSGAVCFILIALLSRKKKIIGSLLAICEIAIPCLVLAHAFGRVGCFLSGCCHGVDSEFGLYFPVLNRTVIPTQLYEFIFLFILSAVLFYFTFSRKITGFNLSIYSLCYGIFRFVIEFFRGDERGAFISGISPSQFWSILLIITGVALIILRKLKPHIFDFPSAEQATNQTTTEQNT